jgi:hypothetical protein
MSITGAFADAPPAIAKETPAAAHTGKAVFERFRLKPCFLLRLRHSGTSLSELDQMNPAAHFVHTSAQHEPVTSSYVQKRQRMT